MVRSAENEVWNAIADPEKIVVVQIAPAVRAAWGEELGLSREEATVGKIIDVWRRLGADYVFDTSFSADLQLHSIPSRSRHALSVLLSGNV